MKKIKVLMVCSQFPPVYGGAGKQAAALASQLIERNCEITIITRNQKAAKKRERYGGALVLRVGPQGETSSRSARIRGSIAICWATIMHIAVNKFDVVHFHGSYWFTALGGIAARITKKPFITKLTRLGEDDAETVANKRFLNIPLGWLYAFGIRHASAVIALSQALETGCRNQFPQVRVERIPNGVDTFAFHPVSWSEKQALRTKFDLPQNGFHLVHSGYLAPHKGVDTLVEAWERIQTDLPADSCLLLVGPLAGFYRELEQEFVDNLQKLSSENRSIRLLGHKTESDMPELYQLADAYALLSHSEGMPNSLLEAIASGLPVVVTEIPGSKDIIQNDHGAIFVDVQNSEQTEAALRTLIKDFQSHNSERAESSRRLAESTYSLEHVADMYLDLYKGLVQ